MMAKTTKHRRQDKNGRERARILISLWFDHRCQLRTNRYRPLTDHGTQAETRWRTTDPLTNAKKARPRNWTQPAHLTAAGTQTRTPPRSGGLNASTVIDPDDSLPPELNFSNKAMLHVIHVNPDAHRALEMDAAGYSIDDISDEIGCGDRVAREYVSIGLAVIVSLMNLREALHW